MTTTKWLLLYALTVPVFFAIDLVWLGVVAKNLYRDSIGHLMRPSPNWGVALVFYLIYIVGIIVFAVRPGLDAGSAIVALGWGAMFGFFAYMTYDLTNWSTLRDWPARIAIIDIVWGITLTGSVALASYFIGRWIEG
jgi:uncharacterized membrane protein